MGRKLFANGTHPPVGKVVYIIDFRFGVDQFDQILDDGNDVFFGQDLFVHPNVKPEFFIHPVAAYLTEVIALVGKEKFIDNTACGFLIRRFGVTQLTVDMLYGLLFGVGRVFLQGVVDNGIIRLCIVLLVQQDGLYIGIHDLVNMLLLQDRIPVQNDLVSFNRYHFSGIFIHEVFVPGVQYPGGQFTAQDFF